MKSGSKRKISRRGAEPQRKSERLVSRGGAGKGRPSVHPRSSCLVDVEGSPEDLAQRRRAAEEVREAGLARGRGERAPERSSAFILSLQRGGLSGRSRQGRRAAEEVRKKEGPPCGCWRLSASILSLPNPLHRQEDFAQRHSDHRGKRRGWSHAGERRERGSRRGAEPKRKLERPGANFSPLAFIRVHPVSSNPKAPERGCRTETRSSQRKSKRPVARGGAEAHRKSERRGSRGGAGKGCRSAHPRSSCLFQTPCTARKTSHRGTVITEESEEAGLTRGSGGREGRPDNR